MSGQCFIDQMPREMGARQINLPGRLNIAKCIGVCEMLNYKYAGVQYGKQCFCDNHHPAVEDMQYKCDMQCAGNSWEKCGGFWRMNVYSTTYPIHLSLAEAREVMNIVQGLEP